MSRGPNVAGAVATVVAVALILLVGIYGMAVITEGYDIQIIDDGGSGTTTTEFDPEPIGSVAYTARGDGSSATVSATRGQALQIDSTDGYAELNTSLTGADWAIGISARLDPTARVDNATYAVLGVNNESVALWYENGSWLGQVNDSGTVSWARVDNGDPTTGWTTLTMHYDSNANSLNLTANGSSSQSTSDTSRRVAYSWQGRLDEWRTWGQSPSTATISGYHADPVAASDTEPDMRLPFHEGEGSTAELYYETENATLVNAGWGAGVRGPTLVAGTDYNITNASGNTFDITALSGGYLDGQPFAFVETGQASVSTGVSRFIGAIGDSYAMAGSVFLLVIVIPIVTTFLALRSER